MVDTRAGQDIKTPSFPTVSKSGVSLPWPAIGTMLVLAAGVVMKFVLATKDDVGDAKKNVEERVAKVEERTTVVEQNEKHLDDAIRELKGDVRAVKSTTDALEANMRTLLIQSDVPPSRIVKPKVQ